jgi:hypothetical protein
MKQTQNPHDPCAQNIITFVGCKYKQDFYCLQKDKFNLNRHKKNPETTITTFNIMSNNAGTCLMTSQKVTAEVQTKQRTSMHQLIVSQDLSKIIYAV